MELAATTTVFVDLALAFGGWPVVAGLLALGAMVVGDLGLLRIEAELIRCQPIAYWWAQNLRQQDAPEIDRFVRYYQYMSDRTATLRASTSVGVR